MADKTPREIFEHDLPAQMKENPARAKEINAIFQFSISGDGGGTWCVDMTTEGGQVTEGENPAAKCVVTTDAGTFVQVASGKMQGTQAFLMGKLKIKGDMNLAMKLGKVLGSK